MYNLEHSRIFQKKRLIKYKLYICTKRPWIEEVYLKTTICLLQDTYKRICLGLSQAKKQLGYTVYICTILYNHTVWKQFSCIVYTHSTASPPRLA